MRIKKHSNGNQYLLTEQNMWVRNFDKSHVSYLDINKTITDKDHFIFLENEVQNGLNRMPWIDSEPFYHENIIKIIREC